MFEVVLGENLYSRVTAKSLKAILDTAKGAFGRDINVIYGIEKAHKVIMAKETFEVESDMDAQINRYKEQGFKVHFQRGVKKRAKN